MSVVMGSTNINSIRNNFKLLSPVAGGKINILIIDATKLEATFPADQFLV